MGMEDRKRRHRGVIDDDATLARRGLRSARSIDDGTRHKLEAIKLVHREHGWWIVPIWVERLYHLIGSARMFVPPNGWQITAKPEFLTLCERLKGQTAMQKAAIAAALAGLDLDEVIALVIEP